jgi:hypothetical protein
MLSRSGTAGRHEPLGQAMAMPDARHRLSTFTTRSHSAFAMSLTDGSRQVNVRAVSQSPRPILTSLEGQVFLAPRLDLPTVARPTISALG